MWKLERVGLVIVFASLTVIAVIVVLLFQNQRDARLAEVRSQGVSLVRVLSRVAYDQLAPGGPQQGALQLLQHSLTDSDFAYSSIVDTEGRVITDYSTNGIIVPAAALPAEPSAWLGQRELLLAPGGRKILEFHAPLLQDGAHRGFVRLGYFFPAFGITVEQLPFVATLALPVFLLVPLFYFLLRQELRPIRSANEQIGRVLEADGLRQIEVSASGELSEFMTRFNRFVDMAQARISALEDDQVRLITSSKLLTYRKQRVETVLESLPEAVMILDESGNVTFANEKVAVIFGATREDILNGSPQDWCDDPQVLSLLDRLGQRASAHSYMDTMRLKLTNIADRSFATKTYPLFSPKDAATSIGTLIVFRDETREALARQARVDFVGHLSHELKSPLNVLGMYSESLLSDAGRSEEFRVEAANVIATEVQRLSTLINGLLSMTQIESGSLTPDRTLVKLRDLLSAAFEEATRSNDDRELEFEINMPREMSPLMVDKDLIRIAVTNLLSNAVKYNREGGTVRLTAEETDDAVRIRVEDTGIGISEEDASRVFEKFYRSDDDDVRARSGHGLGLALAKQIVELHHGTLTLVSKHGQGTEFTINLWKEATSARQAI